MKVLQMKRRLLDHPNISNTDTGAGEIHTFAISKEGDRVAAYFSGYDKATTRKTNKRTGAPLKKAIIEQLPENKNSLRIELYYHRQEFWNEARSFYDGQFGASHQDYQAAEGLHYCEADILKYMEYLTGVKYDAIEYVEELKEPKQWEEIAKRENCEELNNYTERETRKNAESITELLSNGSDYWRGLYDKIIERIEEKSGITPEERKKAIKIAKAGGYREQNIATAEKIAIIKRATTSAEHNIINIYNLVLDSHGVMNYISIDLVSGLIVG